jgi:hypothetical protein
MSRKSVNGQVLLASDLGAGHYFDFLFCRHLVLNLVLFLLSTDKLLGEFCYNRQSAVNTFPRFAYSFVFFILRQYYWRHNFYSTYR